ncbi:MAG: relaxase domain-containing protein [Xanthobacteraceae bacterium]|nr:relaxase domain-containing protein [Xanthobacteraceae bacterium]MBY0611235.1 relaxase domain-containing protein [Beijerinckiaceae bacterium]
MVATIAAGTTARYYLSLTDYYTAGIENQGVWSKLGVPIDAFLGSAIERADFERLHGALGANGRSLLSNQRERTERVGGYDLTFSAPKSISILWGLGSDELRHQIEAAQARAVQHALDVVEAHAAFCRTGKNGVNRESVKLTAATFQHGEARPALHQDGHFFADPNLHTHAVILNLGLRRDGLVGALDGKALFQWKMAAGAVYHAELSRGLRQLGFNIESVGKNGIFEVSGVNSKLKTYFSARRQTIADELSELGLASGDAPALAADIAKASRSVKKLPNEIDRFEMWRQRATNLGFELPNFDLSADRCAQSLHDDREREQDPVAAALTVCRDLTEHESTFEFRQLYAALAAAKAGTDRSTTTIDNEIESLMARGEVVTIASDGFGYPIFSTPEILQIEQNIVNLTKTLVQRKGKPATDDIAHHISRVVLSAEQMDAVATATSGAPITVIEGAPGSGKTTVLEPIKRIWEAAGYRVIGSATAWKIATVLADDLGIESRATNSWLARLAAGSPFIDGKTVLIVDEAGLLSSRQMHVILNAFAAASDDLNASPKLILVGDRNQLQSVGAGSGLRLVTEALPVVSVDTIRRQQNAWHRDAVTAFGHGEAEAAFKAFKERDLVSACQGAKQTISTLVDAWQDAQKAEPSANSLIIAQTNAEVRAISAEVRARLRQAGQLKGNDTIIDVLDRRGHRQRLPVAVGDRVRFLERMTIDGREVINGTEATISSLRGHTNGKTTLNLKIGKERVTVDLGAAATPPIKLSHAYATTIYGSQGLTTDKAFVLVSPGMDRHAAYVASSRSRAETRLFLDAAALEAKARADLPLAQRSSDISEAASEAYLIKQLSRSSLKRTTLDVINEKMTRVPDRETMADLGATWQRRRLRELSL